VELAISEVQALALVVACAVLAVAAIAAPTRWSVVAAITLDGGFAVWTRSSFGALAASALLALALCVGTIVRLRRVKALEAERALEESVAAADARRDAAVLEQRAFLAREIHDVLAHSLSALAIQLERIRLEVAQLPGGAHAADELAQAHGLTSRGLQDARGAISALRGDRSVQLEDLAALVEEFAASTGIDAQFHSMTTGGDMAPATGLLLYRALQETLTNAARHAQPTRIEATITCEPAAVTLRVVNDGVGTYGSRNETGYGVQGLRERVALVNGTVDARAAGDDTFEVLVCLPR